MSTPIARANARTLSASLSQADDRPQSSRRGFLRVLAALAPAVGLAGVPARAVAREEGPEDPALLAIGRRAVDLEKAYELAWRAQDDARDTFYDLCGPVPESPPHQ